MRMAVKAKTSFLVSVVCLLALGGAVSAQEPECKGLAQQKCEHLDRCSWVRSYTTSKGTEVRAFCRRKPQRKKTSQEAGLQSSGS